ncbi:MAG: ankyrin repeat domain-containing protein, partial [Salinivirgaceae bacterium]|nr:ankyrin repeat domain-containing protein [Salinivirgaceae bacterium]
AGVRAALQQGTDANAKDKNGYSALHMAADVCSVEICQMLLDAGADPAAQDAEGRTPLQRTKETLDRIRSNSLSAMEPREIQKIKDRLTRLLKVEMHVSSPDRNVLKGRSPAERCCLCNKRQRDEQYNLEVLFDRSGQRDTLVLPRCQRCGRLDWDKWLYRRWGLLICFGGWVVLGILFVSVYLSFLDPTESRNVIDARQRNGTILFFTAFVPSTVAGIVVGNWRTNKLKNRWRNHPLVLRKTAEGWQASSVKPAKEKPAQVEDSAAGHTLVRAAQDAGQLYKQTRDENAIENAALCHAYARNILMEDIHEGQPTPMGVMKKLTDALKRSLDWAGWNPVAFNQAFDLIVACWKYVDKRGQDMLQAAADDFGRFWPEMYTSFQYTRQAQAEALRKMAMPDESGGVSLGPLGHFNAVTADASIFGVLHSDQPADNPVRAALTACPCNPEAWWQSRMTAGTPLVNADIAESVENDLREAYGQDRWKELEDKPPAELPPAPSRSRTDATLTSPTAAVT